MWSIIWFLFLTIVTELLRPKPKDSPPASLGDFTFPTAEDGRPLPIPIGTVLVAGANIVWYGDLRKKAITQRTGLFGGSTRVGEEFYIGFQAAICSEIDELIGMRWDDKPITYTTTTVGDKFQLTFDQEGLFGGERGEGGISGVMDFYLGTETQTSNDYLERVLDLPEVPGYRSVCYAVSRQMYVGNSKYFKAPAWIVRRCPNTLGLTSGRHIIGGTSANPAAVLYWLLTDDKLAVSIPPAQIDAATFIDVGNQVYTEGLGINFLYDSASIAGDLVEDILRHIDGFRYLNPDNGKFSIGLVRDDYVVGSLLVADETNIKSVDVTEPSWGELVNYLTLEFTDTNFRKRTIPYPNLAGIERRGEIEARAMSFAGFSSDAAALWMAARLSKRYGYPLKVGQFVMNRTAWRLHEGAVFLWSGAPFADSPRVMRVIDRSLGTIDNGEVKLTATEDVFSIDQIAYQGADTDFVDPAGQPLPLLLQRVIEAPYHLIGGSSDRLLLLLAVRSAESDSGYLVNVDRGALGTAWTRTADATVFAAVGDLTAAFNPGYGIDTGSFTVDGGTDLEDLVSVTEAGFLRGDNLVLIDDELFSWRDIVDNGNGTYTVSRIIRGVLDTVPRPHTDNARCWFLRGVQLAEEDPLLADQNVDIKLQPYNGRGVVAFVDSVSLPITTASRAARVYPPGNFKINGSFDPGAISGSASITWAARDRAAQFAGSLVERQDTSSGYTADGDFQLQFYILGVLRRTVNVAGLSYTYTTAERTADYGADTSLPVEVRGYGRSGASVLSAFYQSIEVEMIYS